MDTMAKVVCVHQKNNVSQLRRLIVVCSNRGIEENLKMQ